jgi:8-oxo-dGTP pyrophosphatase MutT (NUDIX family)
MTLDEHIENEITNLAQRYGAPARASVELDTGDFSPFTKTDRYGEVCMVVRRPGGNLITARKTYYPPDITRLLTGGVEYGEPIEMALLRETHEETGLQVATRHFLAVIEYHASPPLLLHGEGVQWVEAGYSPTDKQRFVTFAFLLDEIGGTLAMQDEEEQIESFHEVRPNDLLGIARALTELPDQYDPEIEGSWKAWGEFRAAAHRLVYIALRKLEG